MNEDGPPETPAPTESLRLVWGLASPTARSVSLYFPQKARISSALASAAS